MSYKEKAIMTEQYEATRAVFQAGPRSGGDPEKPRCPEVEQATNRLSSLAHSLLAKMEDLETTLKPVLRQDPACDSEKAETRHRVPLAAELEDIADKIEAALYCATSLKERIEL